MLDYEGELKDIDRRSNEPMQTNNDNDDIFEISSVSVDSRNSLVDATISSAYVAEEHLDDCRENRDKYFAEALRGEISKVQEASIGSTTFSDEPCELFRSDPSFLVTHMDDLEELSDLVSPEHMDSLMLASISSIAGKSKGVSADKLSKLWLITEKLADGAIDQNTQMCRHSAVVSSLQMIGCSVIVASRAYSFLTPCLPLQKPSLCVVIPAVKFLLVTKGSLRYIL